MAEEAMMKVKVRSNQTAKQQLPGRRFTLQTEITGTSWVCFAFYLPLLFVCVSSVPPSLHLLLSEGWGG